MPEYLAPGVYVEETSFRPKSIEGVSTSTAGFVGPTRFGPTEGVPELLTSFSDFERIYGGIEELDFENTKMTNYMAHAVRAFFENGGKRLYVSRIYQNKTGEGFASKEIKSNSSILKARYPGYGKMEVTFVLHTGVNILSQDGKLKSAKGHEVVLVKSPEEKYGFYGLKKTSDDTFNLSNSTNIYKIKVKETPTGETTTGETTTEETTTGETTTGETTTGETTTGETTTGETTTGETTTGETTTGETTTGETTTGETTTGETTTGETTTGEPQELEVNEIYVVTVNVTVKPEGKFANNQTWENLSFHPDLKNSLKNVFPVETQDRSIQLFNPLEFNSTEEKGFKIADALLKQQSAKKLKDLGANGSISIPIDLDGGSDGKYPWNEYEGDAEKKSGLKVFEDLEDISIVAAPGATNEYAKNRDDVHTVTGHLTTHCKTMRYRIAVLDSAEKHLVSQVREYRNQFDSTHAALYYPWVTVLDPATEKVINLPPSGFVAGIYARNDIEHGVHKAPANEIVNLAIDFEFRLNKAQQDVLNPDGINCFRFFEGRGYRLWGARTISSDPEWKYVNLRRYFAFLERSLEKGTQWVVFENNSERLWSNIRLTMEDFLYNEWKSGHLMGESPKKAYFIRCDRSTMTQNDIDNGRLICQIGVAPVRPAEFVIFRIGQWTADRKV